MRKTNYIISIIAIVVILLSYFFWFSPLLMVIAGVSSILCLSDSILSYFQKSHDTEKGIGCLFSGFISFILLVFAFFMNNNWYISGFGDLRHQYTDCTKKISDKDYEVNTLSAILWGCFNKCQECELRKEEEIKVLQAKRKAEEKKEKLEFINSQIKELQEIRHKILNDEYVDIDDYCFSYEVEEDIRESAIDEYKDNFPGISSRYQ